MDNIVKKLLLAYLYNRRPVMRYDKKLHKDFMFFKIIVQEEFNVNLNIQFELISEQKEKNIFKEEPFSSSLERMLFQLVEEGYAAYSGDLINITNKGYEELVRLRPEVDKIAPSVKYMLTRLSDPNLNQRYRNIVKQMRQQNNAY